MEKETKIINNDDYYAFNYFTYNKKPKEYENCVLDQDAHNIALVPYRKEELDKVDQTLEVADKIEEMIMFCGEKLRTDRSSLLDDYDDEGNYTEAGEEHQLGLVTFLGVFLKGEDLTKVMDGVIPAISEFENHDYNTEAVKIVADKSYKGKVPAKICIWPDTFFGDHYIDLYKKGIDVREYNIFGIVDIEKLCKELTRRGLSISLAVVNINDIIANFNEEFAKINAKYFSGEITYEEMNEELSKTDNNSSKEIDSITFDEYFKNYISTRMGSSIRITMPFSQYLRKTGFHK